MTDRIEASMVHASMNALMHLMEGVSPTNTAPPAVVYTAFVGGDERMVRIVCQATADNGRDGILSFFEPKSLDAGPTRIGVTLVEGAMIKLQLGRLWLAPRAERAVLVPRNIGNAHGHYVVEGGRIVQRGLARRDARARHPAGRGSPGRTCRGLCPRRPVRILKGSTMISYIDFGANRRTPLDHAVREAARAYADQVFHPGRATAPLAVRHEPADAVYARRPTILLDQVEAFSPASLEPAVRKEIAARIEFELGVALGRTCLPSSVVTLEGRASRCNRKRRTCHRSDRRGDQGLSLARLAGHAL